MRRMRIYIKDEHYLTFDLNHPQTKITDEGDCIRVRYAPHVPDDAMCEPGMVDRRLKKSDIKVRKVTSWKQDKTEDVDLDYLFRK